MKQLTPYTLCITLLLASCGQGTPQTSVPGTTPAASLSGSLSAQGNSLSACQAMYAAAPNRVQVDNAMRFGEVATLILSFVDDASKGRAITWMDSNLAVDPGNGLGALTHLPMVAVRTMVTPELIQDLEQNLPGLLSIYQDAPLRYSLAESVSFIGADTAQSTYSVSGKGVGVAIIDSGVDGTHADLDHVAKNVKLVGSVTNSPVGGAVHVDLVNTDTSSGHGTHVASTIGGSGEASAGSTHIRRGVAPGATLVGVGAGDGLSILYALQGFDYVMRPEVRQNHNVRIISNSWGTSGKFAPYNPINLASKRAYDAGMIVVFAAGNEGPNADTLNPYSASPCVISVAAGDKKGALASFSSRGVAGDANVHPDVTAPGVKISAARATTGVAATTLPDLDNAQYSTISGTSMATPHISGVIALMLEANPGLNLDTVLNVFKKTSREMYSASSGTTTRREQWEVGYGYVDAHAAVREAARLNPKRTTVETTVLPGWSSSVSPAACVPGANCAVNASDKHAVSVPAGSSALRVATEWGNAVYDLDLYVYDPAGQLMASSAQGVSTGEAVTVSNPVAGTWTVELRGYLNAATTYSGTAEVDKVVVLK
ncbi:S8 family serine peptidase [Deinococcus deserti]|uniref:Putative peptidase S8, Subtilase family n=1 Tax=Deinococcus deserti (strain DSM 17065 / CIP 109153 / LMG 22923 / VCD115) TaxID=546414 RepID=C1D3A4_DEIDV|nr:S8 family serine peptidase [Deinococcus deserti]ACO47893.1 putative peptidase S8, precursor, Subtilase family [Deinococcus deserti VCD115]